MFINIVFLFSFFRNLREVWIEIAKVIYGSSTMFVIVLCFLLFYSLLGYTLFSSNQLSDSFADPFPALYSAFGMYTEATYPNIQIPYFIENRLSAIYFWLFMCISVFLLANLLLAVIFNNYKRILNLKIDNNAHLVTTYFTKFFDQIVEMEIVLNPKKVTFDVSQKDQWFISKETLEEALGGDEFIKKDSRLSNMVW
jgi:hypothetical protein